jgi:hypothetical protein
MTSVTEMGRVAACPYTRAAITPFINVRWED